MFLMREKRFQTFYLKKPGISITIKNHLLELDTQKGSEKYMYSLNYTTFEEHYYKLKWKCLDSSGFWFLPAFLKT